MKNIFAFIILSLSLPAFSQTGIQLGPCVSGTGCIQVQGQAQTANGGTAINSPTGFLYFNASDAVPTQMTTISTTYLSGILSVVNGGTGIASPTGFQFFNGSSTPTSMSIIPAQYLAGIVTPSGSPSSGQYVVWQSGSTISGVSTIPYSALTGIPSIPSSSDWPNAGSCPSGSFVTSISNGSAPGCGNLSVFTSSANGLVPSSGGGTVNYLRADGTWNAPSGNAIIFDNGAGISVTGANPYTVSIIAPLSSALGGTGVESPTGYAYANGANPYTFSTGIPYSAISGLPDSIPVLGTNGSGEVESNTGTLPNDISGTSASIAGGSSGEILYQSAANSTLFVPNGTSGQVLTSNGSSAPSWQAIPVIGVGFTFTTCNPNAGSNLNYCTGTQLLPQTYPDINYQLVCTTDTPNGALTFFNVKSKFTNEITYNVSVTLVNGTNNQPTTADCIIWGS